MAGPNLTIAVEPMESSSIVCGQLAAKTSNDFPQGQLSLVLTITNNEAVAVHLNKVSISFLGLPKVPTSAIAADLTIGATEAKKWYFAPADNIILPLPPPGSIKLDLWCDAFANPATLTLALAPYVSQDGGGGYLFPAKTDDLKTTEYWFGVSAKHGAAGDGTQLFAYDMTVQGFDDVQQRWTAALPGTAGTNNEDFRVWAAHLGARSRDRTCRAFGRPSGRLRWRSIGSSMQGHWPGPGSSRRWPDGHAGRRGLHRMRSDRTVTLGIISITIGVAGFAAGVGTPSRPAARPGRSGRSGRRHA